MSNPLAWANADPEGEIDIVAVQKGNVQIEAELVEIFVKMVEYQKELGVNG